MGNSSFALDVYRTLRSTYRIIKKDLRKKLKNEGITWPQFHALFHMQEEGIPFKELARVLHCNASNITGLIDRMIENELVYRQHSQQDRRVWLIKLTEKGKKMKSHLIPKHMNNIKERMNSLSKEELITLNKLLTKLQEG